MWRTATVCCTRCDRPFCLTALRGSTERQAARAQLPDSQLAACDSSVPPRHSCFPRLPPATSCRL